MTPPLAIAGGVVAAVTISVAFHQFVYEPHIAPKLEILLEGWLERRRLKRRLAMAYREVPVDDVHHSSHPPSQPRSANVVFDTEMDSMPPNFRPLTLNEAGETGSVRRRATSSRSNAADSTMLHQLNLISFETLPASPAQPTTQAPMISRTSTPSTLSSSILNAASPSPRSPPLATAISPVSHPALLSPRLKSSSTTMSSPRSTRSDPLADSILSNPQHQHMFSAHSSPHHSPSMRISPRGILQVHLAPFSDPGTSEDEVIPVHRLPQMTGPAPIMGQLQSNNLNARNLRTPSPAMDSSVYQSFAPSPASRMLSPLPARSPAANTSTGDFVSARSPFSDSLSIVEHPTAPASTASWSDVGDTEGAGSVTGDDLVLGSDAQSWAHHQNRRRV